MNKTPNTPTPIKAFRKGLREVKVGDVDAVREDLKSALGVTTRQSLAAYADADLEAMAFKRTNELCEIRREQDADEGQN